MVVKSQCEVTSLHMVPQINIQFCTPVPLMLAGNNLSQIESVISFYMCVCAHACAVRACAYVCVCVTIGMNGKLLKNVIQKHTKWVTDSLGHVLFMLPRQNICLSGK